MACLIDSYAGMNIEVEVKGGWYIGRPLRLFSFKRRLGDTINVLIGKYEAVWFAQDFPERIKKLKENNSLI